MIKLECANCSKKFEREKRQVSASKIHGSKNAFCTSECAASWNNKHTTRAPRTSKIEQWIQVRVTETFPTLDVHFNHKDAIDGELDIFVPSLKLGIEINGISHYEPIYGEERLKGEQINDELKRKICKERGINLIEVDVSKVKEFKNSIPFMLAVDKVLTVIKEELKRII